MTWSAQAKHYDFIYWFSARDVDLTLAGPRDVGRQTFDLEGVWLRFAKLLDESPTSAKDAQDIFESNVRDGKTPFLLILDNFETFEHQNAIYSYLDRTVLPPSKVVVTSRHDFQGDTQVRVLGMEIEEAADLLKQAARAAGREGHLGDDEVRRIWETCQGHPYAMKLVASSVVAGSGLQGVLGGVMGRADILDALCRRSIESLGDDDGSHFVFLLIAAFDEGLPSAVLAASCRERNIAMSTSVNKLLERSLVEAGPSRVVTMPTAAREFARQRLGKGHVLEPAVRESELFIRRWQGAVAGHLVVAANDMRRALEQEPKNEKLTSRTLGYQRAFAEENPRVWPVIARTLRAKGAAEREWGDAYKRAVETGAGPDVMLEWAECTSRLDQQVSLRVQAVQAEPSRLDLASSVANFLIALRQAQREAFPDVTWVALMRPVAEALSASEDSLDGNAASRLAWTYLLIENDELKARRIVARAVERFPGNEHLCKLAARLNIGHPASAA